MSEVLYGIFLLLFAIGGGAAIAVRLRTAEARAARAEQQLVDAVTLLADAEAQRETAAQQARAAEAQRETAAQQARAAEARLQEVVAALRAPERAQLARDLTRSRPMPEPPRGFNRTLDRLRQVPEHQGDPYAFAVGWEVTRNTPDVASLSLANGPYRSGNIAITGESGHGKGTLGHLILLQLASNCTTSQLRIQIIDPKNSDGALWRDKAHCWHAPALGDDRAAIAAILAQLRAERVRRDQLRAQHQVREWDELPPTGRPPLLLVWIAELGSVTKAIDKCDEWLDDELAKCRASGIVYMLDLQNQSGKEMSWRSHIGTFIAGFQASTYHIRPNIGLGAEEIVELGGVVLTELAQGQFTIRNRRDVITVTVPPLRTAEIRAALLPLPDVPASGVALPTTSAPPAAPSGPAVQQAATASVDIPPEQWDQIAAAARRLEAANPRATRAELFRELFADGDPNARPRGDNYTRLRIVCDAIGALLPRRATETVDTA